MKIGLLTDIHEHVVQARLAIEAMREIGVTQIICLGDFCEQGAHLERLCLLLTQEEVLTVWGNHDFGLCEDARNGQLTNYSQLVAAYAASARPFVCQDHCYFSHIEPWLDPMCFEDLWFYDGLPVSPEKRSRIFDSLATDVAFAGHYHTWFACSESRSITWRGERPLKLVGPTFVVINACLDGYSGVYDTDLRLLTSYRVKHRPRSPLVAID